MTRHFVSVMLLALCACKPADLPNQSTERAIGKAATIRGYNYTGEGVQEFYVDGKWASNLPPYGGGGGDVCCIDLTAWHQGLTVTLDWTMGSWTVPYAQRKHLSWEEQFRCCARERKLHQIVPIQRFQYADTLQVFFLPDDKVEVWVYDAGPQHPDHPSKRGYPVDPSKTQQPTVEETPQEKKS